MFHPESDSDRLNGHVTRRSFLAAAASAPLSLCATAAEPEPIAIGAADWPWWRGPTRDGVAAADQKPPLKWSDTENVLWKAPVPGRGHGSPIVVGDRVFLAAAEPDTQVQSLLCFDRMTGKRLWQTGVHRGNFASGGNTKSSLASSTPACDGKRVYINFLNAGAIHTTALDLDGNRLWQTKITDYTLHQGFGSSPAVYKSLVIVSADNKGGTGKIAGLDRLSGKIVWSRDRPKLPNYASPIILTAAGKEQLILIGCNLVTSLDPMTGTENWEIPGSTEECVTSTVTDGQHIYTSGGYPRNHVSAVKADGSGTVAWENKSRVYVPSMLMHRGHLFAVSDDPGFAMCWKSDTGKEVWNGRLGGVFSSSPVLSGNLIYATNESGKMFVFQATTDGLDVVAENKLGDEVFSTPAICGGRIYVRVAEKKQGQREEVLYCLGK
jgi:outer membrane protein assembly factor BamB